MHSRAVLLAFILTSLGLCQNSNHATGNKKSQVAPRRSHSSISLPATPKTNTVNSELKELEKDTARTVAEPAKKPQNQSVKSAPPIDKMPARTPGRQKSAINFSYQQQRTSGHNTNTVSRPR
jgi:hypothetical protein